MIQEVLNPYAEKPNPGVHMWMSTSMNEFLGSAIPEYHPEGRLTSNLANVVKFSIRFKIKGDARDFIACQNGTDWPDIRNALLRKYDD
ncbi:hypothetical protein ILUMI_11412 [Ignelater luminosus]|uniref:Uncharacterized protein n=1 Tax=Ignelater luminosus TaxID=2038154 RepID=A0A8K0D521_IGNLU|nr:hypothetical protein ILUMI_11412 [Ignelater luminosus]